jgi:hypothetical protein
MLDSGEFTAAETLGMGASGDIAVNPSAGFGIKSQEKDWEFLGIL